MATSHVGDLGRELFPSDLESLEDGRVVTVSGRLVALEGLRGELADAYARCHLELEHERNLAVGSWVQVRGRYERPDATLRDAVVVATFDGILTSDGQHQRFADVGPNLEKRARAKAATRQFFEGRGYLEVDTPVRVAAPGTDVYLEPERCGAGWLITSPEFAHKRLLVGGLPRIFEFAHCTRRDEVGVWHQPEFTMLEWYCLFQPFEQLLRETEHLVVHLAQALQCAPVIDINGKRVRWDAGFERLTVADAFRQFADVNDVVSLAADDEDTYFQLMVDHVDPALSQLDKPVFLTHYPLSQAALAAPSTSVEGCAERFELFMGGVELCNGYGELTCATTQRQRFVADVTKRQQRRLPDLPIDEGLLATLEEGLPPCSGNAVGFDRLLAVLLERPLDRVVAFPATVPS